MPNHKMDVWKLAIGIIFLSQTTIGIMGNLSLLFYYLVLSYREYALKPKDLILMHLLTANTLIILSAGVAHTMAVWGLKPSLNDFGCLLLLFIQGFARNVSMGTTCLLSIFQAVTISPRKLCLKNHKVKETKFVGWFISLLWVFYILIRFILFMYTFIKTNIQNITRNLDFGYCSTIAPDEISNSLYTALVMCPEFLFAVLIIWSSTSMIVTLYGHKQRVQHIRSSHGSRIKCPESKATQNILTLVCTFLAFYTLSTILRGCIALLYNHSGWVMYITHLTSLCFPCFGPYILISHYSIVSRLSLTWLRVTFSPHFIVIM
ncbi:vomeronasal type-1 receptor 4-like isoform X1 [Microtus ochrogaster]|uniref:Vomeronasal type-1 receptor n=2 Tax=Microtus ochrogaster TaxID=79684 RepID=A0ABM1TWW5_MICOH|nr:vomeronasal type-1 receptor 4-like isoform X1 [Microtus ochrogaster]